MKNPILISGARRRMRTFRTIAVFLAYVLALAAGAMLVLPDVLTGSYVQASRLSNGMTCYTSLAILQFALIVLVAPAMTAGAISGERERQTLELMLVTGTGSLSIVWGKLLEAFAFLALLILCALPVMGIALVTGGVTLISLVETTLFLMAQAFGALSIGVFCSALCRRTISATVLAYILVLVIGLGTIAPAFLGGRQKVIELINQPGMLAAATRADALAVLPKSILMNPALGLYSLLLSQNSWLRGLFTGMFSYGNGYYQLLEDLGFRWIAIVNALMVAGVGVALAFAAAPLVRRRKNAWSGKS